MQFENVIPIRTMRTFVGHTSAILIDIEILRLILVNDPLYLVGAVKNRIYRDSHICGKINIF